MNIKRKEAAVKKYALMLSQGVTIEEIDVLLGNDEKKYTADEITEIRQAIGDGSVKAFADKAPKKTKLPDVVKDDPIHYEEWKCEIKITRSEDGKKIVKREPEKLKKLRSCVKISDGEAETLNNAALFSPRHDHVIMYFKPE
jgi:hypothetical protein